MTNAERNQPAKAFDEVDMPPWPLESLAVPTNDEWAETAASVLPPLRMAGLTLTKTKPELLQLVRDLTSMEGPGRADMFLELFELLGTTKAQFEGWATAIQVAQSRLYAAMGKLEEIEEHIGVNDEPSTQH